MVCVRVNCVRTVLAARRGLLHTGVGWLLFASTLRSSSVDMRGHVRDGKMQFYHRRVLIGPLVSCLIKYLKCERKSTATVGATLVQQANYAILVL